MSLVSTPFQEQFRKLTWHIMHQLMSGLWRYAKEHGLSMTHVFILRQIHGEQNGCNVSMISEEMGVSNAAISQTLEHLVQHGLVSRLEDPQDRRNKRITLTAKGEQFLEAGMEARQTWLRDLDTRLSGEEKTLITQAFDILLAKMP
ncbi:MAG: hypothetical protein OHK0031_05720 [Anaerolineales bacterium]